MKSVDNIVETTTTATSPLSSFGKFFRQLVSPATKSEPRQHDIPPTTSAPLPLRCNEINRVFDYFDEDGDGKISASELKNRLRTVTGELSDEEAEMVVRSSDADGDGALGLEDFAKMMEAGNQEEKVDELKQAFGMYSSTKSLSTTEATITPKSLKRMLSRLGQPATVNDCKKMIGKFDLNGDGVLDFEEFRAMMR